MWFGEPNFVAELMRLLRPKLTLNMSLKNNLKKRLLYGLSPSAKKVFCISFQRSGTTSVGRFFSDHGYRVARNNVSAANNWSESWINGNYEKVFNSTDFKYCQVFEDGPWWFPEFYKYLFHRFPDSRFVLMHRTSESWIKSMESHSGGRSLGNTKRHSKVYRREQDYYEQITSFGMDPVPEEFESNGLEIAGHQDHYKWLYELHVREVQEFFFNQDSSRLFACDLMDSDKWRKMADFIGIKLLPNYDVHVNQSK
jgi:hypothetical protein